MENILIIKTNASGDVLRTTVLLHILKGNIFWITSRYNIPLFPDDFPGLVLIPVDAIPPTLFEINFDLVINLEEDYDLATKLKEIRRKQIIGIFFEDGVLKYTSDSSEWFDMSLVSVFSAAKANELKQENTCSYQEILFRMMGKVFSGHRYVMYRDEHVKGTNGLVGIEERVGMTWPNKNWSGYQELIRLLQEDGHDVKVFERRLQLRQYLNDIDQCRLIVCGDSLAMHVALGYGIPCIALFNCTSPDEIYDYGVLRKVKSPLLFQAFYQRIHHDRVISSIPVAAVHREVELEMKTIK